MWQIKQLKAKNFGTHKNLDFSFNIGVNTMVAGINLDDLGAGSNGSGKSTLGDMISVLFTGSPLRKKIKITDCITDGEKYFTVEGILENNFTKEKIWIYRKYNNSTSPNVLKLQLNDKLPTDVLEASSDEGAFDIKDGTKWIFDKLGISQVDFFDYYILSKDTFQSFLLSTDTVMKKVIDRFSNANLVDPVFDEFKLDIARIDSEINKIQVEKTKNDGKIELHKESLESLESDQEELISSYKIKIEDSKSKIVTLEESKVKFQNEVDRYQDDIDFEKKVLENLKNENSSLDSDFDEFKDYIEKVESQIDSKKDLLNNFEQLKSNIEKQLHDVITCPKCSNKFDLKDKDFDLEKSEDELQEYIVDIKTMKSTINSRQEKLTSLKDAFKKIKLQREDIEKNIKKSKSRIEELEDEFSRKKNRLKSIDRDILELNNMILKYEKSLKEENKEIIKNKKKEIKLKISEIERLNEDIDKSLIEKQAEKRVFVEQEMIFKKFKTHLANKCIAMIEGQTNAYLQKVRTNLKIKINGFKELADGRIKEEIEPIVLRNGFEGGSIWKFSGGEKGKLILCNIFALQKIINQDSPSGGLDFSWFDEILESIDYIGMTGIDSMLNSLYQTIMTVSHVKDVGFENELFIKKQGDCSTVVSKMEYLNNLNL